MPTSNHTKTTEFNAWFKGSKVVDIYGQPLCVYHGTMADFDSFRANRKLFFTADTSYAEGFIDLSGDSSGGRLIPAYLSIKKPYDARKLKKDLNQAQFGELVGLDPNFMAEEYGRQIYPFWYWQWIVPQTRDGLIARGYDGLIQEEQACNSSMRCISYAAFYPNQVKSAIGNNGMYDPEIANITA